MFKRESAIIESIIWFVTTILYNRIGEYNLVSDYTVLFIFSSIMAMYILR